MNAQILYPTFLMLPIAILIFGNLFLKIDRLFMRFLNPGTDVLM